MAMGKKCRVAVIGLVFLSWVGCLSDGSGGENTPAPAVPLAPVPYFPIPDRLELCGEPAPLTIQDVKERFDREFTIVIYSHAQVYLWLKRKERYFPWIEKQLAANKLPDDLKYVAVAESDLLTSASSPAGAAGPWQFIPSTASNYGLGQSNLIDERHDFELATGSAFRYLRDLREMFGNWTLAIAAYNCGEKRIQSEIKRQKITDYYALKLPQETERYIFRILAIKEVLSAPERFGYYLPKGAGYPAIPVDQVSLNLPEPMPIQTVAEASGVTYRDIKRLNPALVSDAIPQGTRTLRVPEGKGRDLESRIQTLTAAVKPSVTLHKVTRGETLSGIAAHYDVSVKELSEWNQIEGGKVRIGQSLKIMK